MTALARPPLLVRRFGGAFLRQWPLALAGDVEGIHQARVATRRMREVLPVLARGARDGEPRALRKALRHLTRALGPSRELDVSMLLLDDLAGRLAVHADAAAATHRVLARERAGARAVLQRVGTGIDVVVLVKRIREIAARLDTPGGTSGCARRVSARLGNRARALQHAVEAAGLVYAPGPMHAVRIALKKFRYAFEVADQLGRCRNAATFRRLKGLQDTLGDLHDLQVLAAQVRDADAAVAVRAGPAMERLADYLDDEIRDLHSRYMAERSVLVAVLARAMRLCGTLVRQPAPASPPRAPAARSPRRSAR
jgi:CHAD domain-containing protein